MIKKNELIGQETLARQKRPDAYRCSATPEEMEELLAYLNPSYTPEGMAIMEEAAAWAKSFDDFSICKIDVAEERLNRQQPTTKDWGIKPLPKK